MPEKTILMQGNEACSEGAIAAGCRFFAGYPITPSTEIAESMSEKLPRVGGKFIQMEDEIASISAIIGASVGGLKSMTATSGPGFSLMQEGIGYACMAEIPIVITNVMRGGPSTGLPTKTAQGDIMQARWGTHGDHFLIVLAPESVKETFYLTIKSFNLSEKYRVPVLVMMDECVGHMTEKVIIPPAEDIDLIPRRYTAKKPGEYLPYEYGADLIPEMVHAGNGYFFHITGLTHDERGYPDMSWQTQEKCVHRLVDKIRTKTEEIVILEEEDIKDAEVIVVSYGITSRVALRAIQIAQENGIKNIGRLRLLTVWPFPDKRIAELAKKIKAFVVPEMNYGQMVYEVERCAAGKCKTILVPHGGGTVHNPENIYKAIQEACQ